MTPDQYRKLRQALGTQEQVASMLEVTRPTISLRETGKQTIHKEAALALQKLSDDSANSDAP